MTKLFHEAIVEALESVEKSDELYVLYRLIENTSIPNNHGNIVSSIIGSWKRADFPRTLAYFAMCALVSVLEERKSCIAEKQDQQK